MADFPAGTTQTQSHGNRPMKPNPSTRLRTWIGCPNRVLCLALLAASLVHADAWADDWPQWMGPKRDGVWRETGILDKFPNGGPKVRWRAPIGMGYSGPAVAGGKV